MHRRLLIVLLILFSQMDLSARSISLSAESFTWEVMVAQERYHAFPSAVTERNDYHPYGARHSNSSLTKASGNRWRFSGKEEFDDAFGLPQSDFGARFYDRAAWSSLDPLAEKYYSLSPYAFCAGNPIIFVDRDGRDWYSYNLQLPHTDSEPSYTTIYAWTDATTQDEFNKLGINGIYLGKVVVVFDGFYDEKLGNDGSLTGEGAKAANVTVYGPKGADDIAYYTGFTMSSDFERFGAIDNGIYYVSFVKNAPNNSIPKTHIIEHGNPVDCLYGINNSYPNYRAYSETKKDRIYIHRTNNNGFAGYNKDRNIAVSVGCLLIHGPDWPYYDKQINNTNYTLILNRR